MDWKRIMNRKDKQADMTEEIEQLLTDLIPELNLRLIMDMEYVPNILWVESITVTACESVSGRPSAGSGPGGVAGRLRSIFTGFTGRARFLKNKK